MSTPLNWEGTGTHRIPFAVYTDAQRHRMELERFFYRGHWCYVGLEVEIPQVGDFKRTQIGERSVIMTRANDGQVHVVENVEKAIQVVNFWRKHVQSCACAAKPERLATVHGYNPAR